MSGVIFVSFVTFVVRHKKIAWAAELLHPMYCFRRDDKHPASRIQNYHRWPERRRVWVIWARPICWVRVMPDNMPVVVS